MATVLYIETSPRKELSMSILAATEFLEAYKAAHPGDTVKKLDLFAMDLPPFNGLTLQAKYAILHGKNPTKEQQAEWKRVEELIAEFKSADKYVLSVPMWNFSIPYRLKHYLDIIIQPGYVFKAGANGFEGLVTGKPLMGIYARGGDYSTPETAAFDLQTKYVELIFGFMGFTDFQSIIIEPTLQGGMETAERKAQEAIEKARTLARTF